VIQYYNFFKGLYFNLPIPTSVSINLTNKCNQHCIYCEIGQGLIKTNQPLITLHDLKWIIREMNKVKISSLCLGGGEPLLFKEIFELIQYAHDFGIKCEILTNGMLLDRLSQDQLDIFHKCTTGISVSIDSFSNEKEEEIRGVTGALTQPIKGIKKILNNNINVGINTVISSYNYDCLFDLVKNADEMGIYQIKFQPVIFISNYPENDPIPNKKNLNITPENLPEIKKQFGDILNYQKNSKIKTNTNLLDKWFFDYINYLYSQKKEKIFFKKVLNRFWCGTIYNTIFINYYGQILPCNMLKPKESIKDSDNNPENKNLLEIWNKSTESIRKGIKNEIYPDECRSCVCSFDHNLLCSMFKYPIANHNNISYFFELLLENIKK